VLSALRRGLLAGAVGGLLSGAFGFLLAEPVMDRAVDLEAARSAAAGEHTVETFTRNTQHVGFLLATLVVGVALGVLYAVVHQALEHLEPARDPWARAVLLGGAGFFGLSLVPFLRYPSNPPGVGDAATIDSRAHLWTVSLVLGLAGAALAALVARSLRERGTAAPLRQLAAVAVLAGTIALTFVLPPNTDPIQAPVHLVWQFRLLSLATLALLWGGLAAAFGLLGARADRRTTERV
jgi:predicted cobalt transporter CbtA